MESQDYAHFVDQHRAELIERVRAVDAIGRGLLERRVLRNRLTMLLSESSQSKMKNIYQDLDFGGVPAKETFYKLLMEHEPQLLQELGMEKVTEEVESHRKKLQHIREKAEKEKQELEAWRAAVKAAEMGLHQIRDQVRREREEAERMRDELKKEKASMDLKNKTPTKGRVALKSPVRKCHSLDHIYTFGAGDVLKTEKASMDLMNETQNTQKSPVRKCHSLDHIYTFGAGDVIKTEKASMDLMNETRSPIRKCHSLDHIYTFAGHTPGADASIQPSAPELRLVLLGRSTAGKSLVANAILGREVFASWTPSPTAAQMSSERKDMVIAGRRVVVVNTPDWFSSTVSQVELWQDVKHCMELSAPGPHAFLLVTETHKYGEGQATILEKMMEVLGDDCFPHTIVLLTHAGDVTKSITGDFVHTGSPDLQRIINKCGNRYHILNTSNRPEGYQMTRLLENIQKMVEGNQQSFYSSEMHKEVMSQIQQLEENLQRARAERKLREERAAREKFEKELQDSMKKKDTMIQEQKEKIIVLENRIVELEEELKEERDEGKKKQLEEELKKEVDKRNITQKEIQRLREDGEREKSELEEKHKQEIEVIRENYEGMAQVEAERHLMKIFLPELFGRLQSALKTKIHTECQRQIEEKNIEIAAIKEAYYKKIERMQREKNSEIVKLKIQMIRKDKRKTERLQEEMKTEIARMKRKLESKPPGSPGENKGHGEVHWILKNLVTVSLLFVFLFVLNHTYGSLTPEFILVCFVLFNIVFFTFFLVGWGLRRAIRFLRRERILS